LVAQQRPLKTLRFKLTEEQADLIKIGRSARLNYLRRFKMAKAVTLDFSKFFPTSHSFVAVKARASHGDDFFVNLTFGDGDNKVTYFIDEYNQKEVLKQMQTMLEGLEKTMEFVQKATSMPVPEASDWFGALVSEANKEPKKAPSKKKAAPKK